MAKLLAPIIQQLVRRAADHDVSKLNEDELIEYASAHEEFDITPFGTPEYLTIKERIKPAIDLHYSRNRHHPEFHNQHEQWKPVVGFESNYEVSSFGNVRSIKRIIIRNKQGNFTKPGQVLTQYITPKGYCRLQLQSKGKCENVMVHVLVAKAFIPNPNNKLTVNHADGCKTNNCVDNLEWATQSEQLLHAYKNDLKRPSVKYVVRCESLDITTVGIEAMEKELRKLGYHHARSAGIWRCINDSKAKHLDLEFTATKFETWMNSPINRFTLVDLIEMMADWKSATQNHDVGSSMEKSIDFAVKKYSISNQLKQIILNTAKEFGMLEEKE